MSHMKFFPTLESYFLFSPAHGSQGQDENVPPQGPKAWVIAQLKLLRLTG